MVSERRTVPRDAAFWNTWGEATLYTTRHRWSAPGRIAINLIGATWLAYSQPSQYSTCHRSAN